MKTLGSVVLRVLVFGAAALGAVLVHCGIQVVLRGK